MKVLHINNIAGVASLLVKGLRQKGINAKLVVRERHKYGYPYEKAVGLPARRYLLYILKLSYMYDIIHIHGFEFIQHSNVDVLSLSFTRLVQKKVVLHLHGTDIRMNQRKFGTQAAMKLTNNILVSTPDLRGFCRKAIWLPNPVDKYSFMPSKHKKHGALFLSHWYEPNSEKYVREKCREMNLDLTVIDPKDRPIPYSKMPCFLNKFEVFFDRFTIPSLSKTALEALACGCKVIGWKGQITEPKKILKNHDLEIVTKKLIKIYCNL